MPASDYRDTIKQVSAEYPGIYGAVPPELLEAIVERESEGKADLMQSGSGAMGLGQIMTGGYEYGVAVNNPAYVSKCGNAPNLYDPYCNLAVAAIGLAARHDEGVEARKRGDYGSWSDWFVSMGGYFGAVTNDENPADKDSTGDGLNSLRDYYNFVRRYIFSTFDGKTYENIDKQGDGVMWTKPQVDSIAGQDTGYSTGPITYEHDKLYFDITADESLGSLISGTLKGAKDGITGAIDSLGEVVGFTKKISGWIEGLIKFGPRLGFIVLGGVLVIGAIALWST